MAGSAVCGRVARAQGTVQRGARGRRAEAHRQPRPPAALGGGRAPRGPAGWGQEWGRCGGARSPKAGGRGNSAVGAVRWGMGIKAGWGDGPPNAMERAAQEGERQVRGPGGSARRRAGLAWCANGAVAHGPRGAISGAHAAAGARPAVRARRGGAPRAARARAQCAKAKSGRPGRLAGRGLVAAAPRRGGCVACEWVGRARAARRRLGPAPRLAQTGRVGWARRGAAAPARACKVVRRRRSADAGERRLPLA
jgi:hypothetical protein